MRLTERFRKRARTPAVYTCPRCGQDVEQLTPDDKLSVNEHRLLHLAKEWSASLNTSRGWTVDDDGGLRPVAD